MQIPDQTKETRDNTKLSKRDIYVNEAIGHALANNGKSN